MLDELRVDERRLGRRRADGIFRGSRRAQLADDQDVERGVQRAGHFRGHHHAAARQPEHQRPLHTVRLEDDRQLLSGVVPIDEDHGRLLPGDSIDSLRVQRI